jgi:hypothetical protein
MKKSLLIVVLISFCGIVHASEQKQGVFARFGNAMRGFGQKGREAREAALFQPAVVRPQAPQTYEDVRGQMNATLKERDEARQAKRAGNIVPQRQFAATSMPIATSTTIEQVAPPMGMPISGRIPRERPQRILIPGTFAYNQAKADERNARYKELQRQKREEQRVAAVLPMPVPAQTQASVPSVEKPSMWGRWFGPKQTPPSVVMPEAVDYEAMARADENRARRLYEADIARRNAAQAAKEFEASFTERDVQLQKGLRNKEVAARAVAEEAIREAELAHSAQVNVEQAARRQKEQTMAEELGTSFTERDMRLQEQLKSEEMAARAVAEAAIRDAELAHGALRREQQKIAAEVPAPETFPPYQRAVPRELTESDLAALEGEYPQPNMGDVQAVRAKNAADRQQAFEEAQEREQLGEILGAYAKREEPENVAAREAAIQAELLEKQAREKLSEEEKQKTAAAILEAQRQNRQRQEELEMAQRDVDLANELATREQLAREPELVQKEEREPILGTETPGMQTSEEEARVLNVPLGVLDRLKLNFQYYGGMSVAAAIRLWNWGRDTYRGLTPEGQLLYDQWNDLLATPLVGRATKEKYANAVRAGKEFFAYWLSKATPDEAEEAYKAEKKYYQAERKAEREAKWNNLPPETRKYIEAQKEIRNEEAWHERSLPRRVITNPKRVLADWWTGDTYTRTYIKNRKAPVEPVPVRPELTPEEALAASAQNVANRRRLIEFRNEAKQAERDTYDNIARWHAEQAAKPNVWKKLQSSIGWNSEE